MYLKNKNALASFLKKSTPVAESGMRTRNFWYPSWGNILHLCMIQDTNAAADTKYAHYEHN